MCPACHEQESINVIIPTIIIIIVVTNKTHHVQLPKPSWQENFEPSNPVYIVDPTLSASTCTVAEGQHETTKRAFVYDV